MGTEIVRPSDRSTERDSSLTRALVADGVSVSTVEEFIAFHVNMWRLVSIAGIEAQSIRAATEYCGHRSMLRSLRVHDNAINNVGRVNRNLKSLHAPRRANQAFSRRRLTAPM